MRKNRLAVSVLIISVLLYTGLPTAAMADSGPVYYSAGMLVPTTSNDIRMTREVLTIDYSNQIARKSDSQLGAVDVHARFWFRNEGKAVTQKMGFPLGREELSGFGMFGPEFTVTVDGTAIIAHMLEGQKVTAGSELTYDMWSAYEVSFATGQTRVIDVTYRIRPRGGYFLYVLQTGRLWKGPIGDLTIDVNFGRPAVFPDLLSVQPVGYRVQGNHILWHFTDYEPQQDIEIESMTPAFWQTVRPLKEAAERTGAEADWYRYALALLPDNIVGRYPAGSQGEGDVPSDPQGFIRGLQTSTYADYVQRTLLTALNHCTHGSANARILDAAYQARFSSYQVAGDFLNGVEVWTIIPSTRAHTIYERLTTSGLTIDSATPEETRLLTLLTVNMAGESMTGGYTLNAIHELEQAQALARGAGMADNNVYQSLFQGVWTYLSPWDNPRLPVGTSSVPRIEVQQQRMDAIVGGPAWRIRIILHQTLPAADVAFVVGNALASQPIWDKMPEVDNMTGQSNEFASVMRGFSDVDPDDYLVILSLPEVRNADEFWKTLTSLTNYASRDLLYNRRPTLTAPYPAYAYPADTAARYPLQFAAVGWLQAIKPTLQFDMDRGVTVTLDRNRPMSDALCDMAEAEMNRIIAMFDDLPWAGEYEIGKTLQRNLQLIQQTRGKNPSVTMVTYAADGTIAKSITAEHAGEISRSIWVILAGLAGLVAGLVLGLVVASRKRKSALSSTIQ